MGQKQEGVEGLDVIAVAEDLPAVLSDAAAASGVVVDLEGRVGGALQQVAHSISAGGVRESLAKAQEIVGGTSVGRQKWMGIGCVWKYLMCLTIEIDR